MQHPAGVLSVGRPEALSATPYEGLGACAAQTPEALFRHLDMDAKQVRREHFHKVFSRL